MANTYHEQLAICKGVQKTPGDTNSQEQGLKVVDLLGIGLTGWTVDAEWYPNRPALKGGGVWQDSNAATGSVLLDAYDSNVTENLTLDLSASDALELATRLSVMEKMIRDARLFWSTDWQIEPVYLKWQARNAKGPQYALIYNIEMDVQRNGTIEDYTRSVTMQITREPYWRWEVEPGGSPTKWTMFKNGAKWGAGVSAGYPVTNVDDYPPLDYQYINNYHRLHSSGGTCNQNYITIEAENLPGDVPPLIRMTMPAEHYADWGASPGNDENAIQKIWIGRKTNPQLYNTSGTVVPRLGSWPVDTNIAGQIVATMGTDTSLSNNTAMYSNTAASCVAAHTGKMAVCTFANITDQTRVTWNAGMNSHRGRYMVFFRGFQSGGSAGDVTMYLAYGHKYGVENSTQPISPEVSTLATPQYICPITYLGEIVLPPNTRAGVGLTEQGIQRENISAGLTLLLKASATSTTPNLNIFDLVLIPIDESAVVINFERYIDADFDTVTGTIIYDTTGYQSHGRETAAGAIDSSVSDSNIIHDPEIIGSDLELEPGVDNRLYFLFTDYQTGSGGAPGKGSCLIVPNLDPTANTGKTLVSIDIVPRSIGARDD